MECRPGNVLLQQVKLQANIMSAYPGYNTHDTKAYQ